MQLHAFFLKRATYLKLINYLHQWQNVYQLQICYYKYYYKFKNVGDETESCLINHESARAYMDGLWLHHSQTFHWQSKKM